MAKLSVVQRVIVAGSLLVLPPLSALGAPVEASALAAGSAPAPPPFNPRPFVIPGGQVASGLHVVNSDRFVHREMAGYREYGVFTDPARARAYEKELKEGVATPFAVSDTCFAAVSNFTAPEQSNGRAVEWDAFSADRLMLQTFPGDTSPKVIPIRAERWLEVGGKVRLETTEFWADTRTGGTRLIARTESELTPVAAPFAGVVVYAFRSGPEAFSFVVRRDTPRHPAAPDEDPLSRLGFIQPSRGKSSAFDARTFRTTIGAETIVNPCAFEHVTLEIRPEPSLEETPEQAQSRRLRERMHKGLLAPSRPLPRDTANVVFAVVLKLDAEPNPPPPATGAEPAFPVNPRVTLQLRTLVLNLGLARAPTPATTPVPSVSYRWLDRARSLAF